MKTVLVLFLAGICYASAQCPSTGIQWVERGNSCYYFIINRVTWFEAAQYCTYLIPGTLDTHLISIRNADEQQWLQNYLTGKPELRGINFWTSGNILDRRAGWTFLGGRPAEYTNWAPGEPNQSGFCVQIWGEYNYQWDDADCYGEINFICEFEKEVPTTTTMEPTSASTTIPTATTDTLTSVGTTP